MASQKVNDAVFNTQLSLLNEFATYVSICRQKSIQTRELVRPLSFDEWYNTVYLPENGPPYNCGQS